MAQSKPDEKLSDESINSELESARSLDLLSAPAIESGVRQNLDVLATHHEIVLQAKPGEAA